MGWLSRDGAALQQLQKAVTVLLLVYGQLRSIRSENEGIWLCDNLFLLPFVLLQLVDGPPIFALVIVTGGLGRHGMEQKTAMEKEVRNMCAHLDNPFLPILPVFCLHTSFPRPIYRLETDPQFAPAGSNMRLTTT